MKNNPITAIASRLTPMDERMLRDIYAPETVAVPDENPWRNLTVFPDGRIRFYGAYRKKHPYDADCDRCYIESGDGGLSWKRYIVEDKNLLCESKYIPFLDKYMGLESKSSEIPGDNDRDTYAVFANAPDEAVSEKHFICHNCFCLGIYPLEKKDRIIVVGHEKREGQPYSKSFYMTLSISDDGGKTWKEVKIDEAPYHEKTWPHKGFRWQANHREPCLEELEDGTLVLMSRTGLDYHYINISHDHGDTWEKPRPSIFHGTSTNCFLKRLSDGRLILFWCNTKPLPELPTATGNNVDAFTNRDALHAAISEDGGKTWLGYREIALNEIRCASDFRSNGGPESCLDKSVHQVEAIELPFGKMLVAYGQHYSSRRIAIFDLCWLYETSRSEDFIHGLGGISTQSYLKSILGGYRGTNAENALKNVGHCSYNRVSGSVMVPHPDGNHEALSIASSPDERLLTPICGAVWNYPTAKSGEVKLRARIGGAGLRVSLLDYWMNPCDVSVEYFADYSIVLRPDMHPDGEEFSDFLFEFDCENGTVRLTCGDYLSLEKPLCGKHPSGLCYLHMQSAEPSDTVGSLIERIDFKAK